MYGGYIILESGIILNAKQPMLIYTNLLKRVRKEKVLKQGQIIGYVV